MKKITISILAISIASIALVGISQTDTITAQEKPQGNAMYVFGEGVYPQATFEFRDAIVTYDFQLYDMSNNLFNTVGGFTTRQAAPEFTLIRIVGDTPYLHRAVDETFANNGKNSGLEYPYKQFDVTVDLIQEGEAIRSIEYGDCSIANYKITTRTDNEEAYTTGGKTGFAVVETYTFTCNGYMPVATSYDSMVEEIRNKKPYQ